MILLTFFARMPPIPAAYAAYHVRLALSLQSLLKSLWAYS